MVDVLQQIIEKKKERLSLSKQSLSQEELKQRITQLPPTRNFLAALSKPNTISLIAEIKKASPSKGIIREEFDPLQIAKVYVESGVQAISVLTEEDYFQGSLRYLEEIRKNVQIPILRKDFIFDPYQIYESRFFGADAVLLIAEALSKERLTELISLADSLGLQCLVEAHEEKELKKILNLKVPTTTQTEQDYREMKKKKSKLAKYVDFAIGINNRDLRTLQIDLKTPERLYPLIPRERIVVVESGLNSRQEILFLKILGVKAVLIGEAVLTNGDIKGKIEELMGW